MKIALKGTRRSCAAMSAVKWLLFVILAVAAAGIISAPNFFKARTVTSFNPCACTLLWIQAAKEQWARENNKTVESEPTVSELLPYLKKVVPVYHGTPHPSWNKYLSNNLPNCDLGESRYTIGKVGERPSCLYSDHSNFWYEAEYQRNYGKR